MSTSRKVIVAVSGGIAAYRAVELVRALQTAGFDPHVAMTAAAERFVTPLTFAAISGHHVITSLWTGPDVPLDHAGNETQSSIEHIEEAQTTAALLFVPATAHTLAKLAHGLADDFPSTLYLATSAPVLIAPAMNSVMWQHPAVQQNLTLLRARGNVIVEPEGGYLACGMTGPGRLAPLPAIVAALEAVLPSSVKIAETLGKTENDLARETVLITAGGTREPIDGVRFLGNRSSGRMGYALAEEALSRGAQVVLIASNVTLPPPPGVELIPVSTAAEMRAAVLRVLPRATLVFKAAAVADFRLATPASSSISEAGVPASAAPTLAKLPRAESLTLHLEPTEDIVAEIVSLRRPGTLVLAFAAEIPKTGESPIPRAREKMLRKGVDALLVNDVSHPALGFDSDQNAGTLLFPNAPDHCIPPTNKRQMAAQLIDEILNLRKTKATTI